MDVCFCKSLAASRPSRAKNELMRERDGDRTTRICPEGMIIRKRVECSAEEEERQGGLLSDSGQLQCVMPSIACQHTKAITAMST